MEYYSDSDNDLDKLVENAAEEDDDGYAGVSEAEEDNSATGTGTVAGKLMIILNSTKVYKLNY